MTKKPVTESGLWAPIIKNPWRREWIDWTCVRSTRREAKAEHLRGVPPEFRGKALANVRFARVTITEVVPSAPEEGRK